MDNMNIRKINGFTVQLVADGVYAIDEFGIALMYLIIGKTQALLLDTGVGAGNVHAVVKELTDVEVVDEMLAILSDRNEIIKKKESEQAQAKISEIYRFGLDIK